MKYFIICLFILILFFKKRKQLILTYDESTYFTTWGTGINQTRSPEVFELNYNSIRQIIRVSQGGEKIRIKISNIIGESDLEIKKIYIADLLSETEINTKMMKPLTFNGKDNIIINSGEEKYSDTINYLLKTFSFVAISIYFGKVPKKLTGHNYALTYSYLEKGNKIKKRKFSQKFNISHTYFISLIEISSENPKDVIVCFGDSITDGVKFKDNIRDNYPDMLFEYLYKNNKNSNISVVNEGINSDKLLIKGLKRYEHDVLSIKGVKYIISLYGVNDLNVDNATSQDIISGFKKIIEKAHKKNIKIYAGTIMPFSKYKKYLWNENKEKVRHETNNWIRETKVENGGFDGFFDFDKYVKDDFNETQMKYIYDSGDGIHPGYEGYKRMIECINDLTLFNKKR